MVYFITHDDKYVKIGVAKNPAARIKELQTGNPIVLKLWLAFPGGVEEERLLHWWMSGQRVNGEWFLLSDEFKNFIGEWAKVSDFSKMIHEILNCQSISSAKRERNYHTRTPTELSVA